MEGNGARQPGRAPAGSADGSGHAASGPASATPSGLGGGITFVRQLVWFHHIKSTAKRKTIVASARRLGVRGFSKPGFPGVATAAAADDQVGQEEPAEQEHSGSS